MKVVFNNRYRAVYSSDPAAALGRLERVCGELRDSFEFVEPQPASEEDILRVHSLEHVDSVKAYPVVYEIALLAAGGAVKASEIAMLGEPAFGLIRPPGHHASRDSSWGFCYFNNVAVGVEKLRVEGKVKRALIVDIDLHYGDGTANIFSSSRDVVYFHPEGGNRQSYLDELRNYLLARHEGFDVLALSAGFDRHEQDWGGMLKTEDYHTIGTMIKEFAESHCQGRRFAVLEGGYNHSVLGKNVKALLEGMK